MHPAAADCALHLGAVPQRAEQAARGQPSRVPVGFGAYSTSRLSSQPREHLFLNGLLQCF